MKGMYLHQQVYSEIKCIWGEGDGNISLPVLSILRTFERQFVSYRKSVLLRIYIANEQSFRNLEQTDEYKQYGKD